MNGRSDNTRSSQFRESKINEDKQIKYIGRPIPRYLPNSGVLVRESIKKPWWKFW